MMKWSLEEISKPAAWRSAAAELLATGLFVFLGTGAVVASGVVTGGEMNAARLAVIALAHGLAIMLLVAATANISGGHINPAVTIVMWFTGRITTGKAILYVAAQLIGAIIGSLLLVTVVNSELADGALGAHALGPVVGSSAGAGFLVEIILTFALLFVIFAVAVHKTGLAAYAPAAIGLVVLVDIMVGLPMTGASMNPARSLGPALVSGEWANHWIYWAGPIVGGLLGGLVYSYLFMSKQERKET